MTVFRILFDLSILSFAFCQWTVNRYPNPKTNVRGCGNNGVTPICDPDSLLSSSNRASLARRLSEVARSTQGMCRNDRCAQKGLILYVALTDRIQSGSGSHVTNADQENFANGLRNKWQLDPECSKGALITLSKSDRTFWTAKEAKNPICK